jgi:hypothetical protein
MSVLKRSGVLYTAMFSVGLASLVVFVWAAHRLYAYGVRASDTNTTGTRDPIVLTSLPASFVVLVASAVGVVMLVRRSRRRRRALDTSASPDAVTADAKSIPR